MKKLSLILLFSFLFGTVTFSQKVEMKVGDPIKVVDVLNKKGKSKGYVVFEQNDEKLKYMSMYQTLQGINVCEENMQIAKKHRTGALVMTVIGVITIPLGYLILIGPIMSKKKKEIKYVILAIEDYNKSLE